MYATNIIVIHREKRNKKLNNVQPIEDKNKNHQNFKGKTYIQKEVLPTSKLLDHAYE